MVMIVILEMANVRYCLIIDVLVLPSDKMSFICYHFHENVNFVCDVNENVSSSNNANRKRKRTHDALSKLWHYRLGHILRGE